jgi:hypothetical protein
MDFSDALRLLKDGKAVRRETSAHPWGMFEWRYVQRGCNRAGYWVIENFKPIYAFSPDKKDLDATDWVEVPDVQAQAALKPAGKMRCDRRGPHNPDSPFVYDQDDSPTPDYWRERDGRQVCSYCGSMHPDAFMEGARTGVEICPTDKSYKAYFDPRRSHAKFYFQHLSEEQMQEFIDLLNQKKMNIAEPGYFYSRPFFIAPPVPEPAKT